MPRRRASYSSDEDESPIRNRKRARIDELSVEERLQSLITRIGNKDLDSIERNVEGLASVLRDDIQKYRDTIIDLFINCVLNTPERMTIYSCLIGILNARNFAFGGEFVDKLIRTLKESLKKCEFESCNKIIRFLSDLVNCSVITSESLIMLYEDFLEVTNEESQIQVRSDAYVYAVMYSLPYAGLRLYEDCAQRLKTLLSQIDRYLGNRKRIHVEALRVWDNDDPHPQEDYLDSLWAQINNLQRQNWVEKVTWRLHPAFSPVLEEGKPHKLQQVIPPNHDEDACYPLPRVTFRMFDYADVAVDGPTSVLLPGAHAIERFLIEDQIAIIIQMHRLDRKACAKHMVNIPCRVKLPLNWIIVEVILDHMLRLPQSPHLQLCYGVLLIELCKEMPETMPQVLAQATEILFERLDYMKIELINRFSNWFTYHLSNYKFQWSWSDWIEVVEQPPDSPKSRFVAESLQVLMRYSYFEYIERIVPKEFAPLLPKPPGSINKYANELIKNHPDAVIAKELLQSMKERCGPDVALDILKKLNNIDTKDDISTEELQIDVFLTVLLNLGNKTFSHAFALIERYGSLIRALVNSIQHQMKALAIVYDVWHEQPQILVVLLERLLRNNYITLEAIVRWVYSKQMHHNLIEFFTWEIVLQSLAHAKDLMKQSQHNYDKALHNSKSQFKSNTSSSRKHRRAARRCVNSDDDDDESDEDMRSDDSDADEGETGKRASRNEIAHLRNLKEEAVNSYYEALKLIFKLHMEAMLSFGGTESAAWWRNMMHRMREILLTHHSLLKCYENELQELFYLRGSQEFGKLYEQFLSMHS